MNKNIYIGFYCNKSHDSSISIIKEGKIYSIEIERLNKIKHSSIYMYNNYKKYIEDLYISSKKFLGNETNNILYINLVNINLLLFNNNINNTIIYDEHHLLHASSVYYGSEFEDSAILTVDCYGYSSGLNKNEAQAIFKGEKTDIIKLYTLNSSNENGIGIGKAYGFFSEFIGLEEGSVMGLSAYGNPDKFKHIKIFDYNGFDVIFCKNLYSENDGLEGIIKLKKILGVTNEDYNQKSIDITKSIFADIAAKIQKETEDAMVYLAKKAYEITKSSNLCIAGGVALNILANTRILNETEFKNISVGPASNDGGLSLGSAYYGYHIIDGNKKRIPIVSAGIGYEYKNDFIEKEIDNYKQYLEYEEIKDYSEVSKLLKDGNIIGWFQGGSEFGPRALGFRSILASPLDLKIKDRVNKIKSRELWRPVAPSVLEEKVSDFFETNYLSPFMTFSTNVRKDKIDLIPGVVHVDGTSRYHTVNQKQNSKYYDLLSSFYKLTNIPILINTPFNIKGQPIVESPKDAIETFLSTDLDYLVIGKYIISKKEIFPEFKFNKYIHILELNYNKKIVEFYVKKWKILRKFLFNIEIDDDFEYDEGYIYSLKILNIQYKIFIGKDDNNGAYYKKGNILLRIDTKNEIGSTFVSGEIKTILDNIVLIISKNYEKLEKLII